MMRNNLQSFEWETNEVRQKGISQAFTKLLGLVKEQTTIVFTENTGDFCSSKTELVRNMKEE